MAVTNAAQDVVKTVADPNAAYESIKDVWTKHRAVCNGERFVKAYDNMIDPFTFKNLLIPFSPSMTPVQYNFYKAEAELPGITSQFARMLIGGLLRKQPLLKLPDGQPEEVHQWLMHQFGKDDSALASFIDEALWEEMQTSRAWVFVDYPHIEDPEGLTKEELLQYKPFPVLYKAESIINWRVRINAVGKTILDRIVVKGTEERFDKNEFHPTYHETVWVHELSPEGNYQIRVFQNKAEMTDVAYIAGEKQPNKLKVLLEEVKSYQIKANGKPLNFIPAWPLNGSIDIAQPMLTPIIDKEIALYNKISRRNHLLYGAATYTPYIASDMSEDEFDDIVRRGLGSWIHLRQDDTMGVLDTPTDALEDMDRAIAANIEEMAKLGIRMLTPETDQSGVALQIRNASQTAQLGSLNHKICNTIRQIIAFMIYWRYGTEIEPAEIEFTMSSDFNPLPIGEGWLRLATEWYEGGLLPRSAWLTLLKHNEMISVDYDDELGQKEISKDLELVMAKQMKETDYLSEKE
jgi:hypothetical protein